MTTDRVATANVELERFAGTRRLLNQRLPVDAVGAIQAGLANTLIDRVR